MATRNTVACDGAEVSVVIAGERFFFGKDAEGGGWYVGRDGWFELFYSYRVAAAHFRQLTETALLEDAAMRRWEREQQPEPAFVLGRVQLVEADLLPV